MGQSIITFGCSKFVHVYSENCSVRPMPPFKSHSSIQDAKDYLIGRHGKYDVEVIRSGINKTNKEIHHGNK